MEPRLSISVVDVSINPGDHTITVVSGASSPTHPLGALHTLFRSVLIRHVHFRVYFNLPLPQWGGAVYFLEFAIIPPVLFIPYCLPHPPPVI